MEKKSYYIYIYIYILLIDTNYVIYSLLNYDAKKGVAKWNNNPIVNLSVQAPLLL